VEKYVKERDDTLNTITVLKNTALDRGTDPSAQDLELMERGYARIDEIDKMLKVLGEDAAMDEDTKEKLLRGTPPSPSPIKYRSGGEMLWDCLHATFGSAHDHNDQEAKRRWDVVMKRAAQHMGAGDGSLTTPTAGGVGALYVVPVVGPVISLFPTGQPWMTAIGKRPAPDALSFNRPRIVDPDYYDGAAAQGLQKAELTSKKFDIKADTLSLTTVGGYLNVSQQLMSLQPGGWDIIVNQLSERVAYAGEASLLTEVAKTTAKVTLAAGATSGAVIAALFQAAETVYNNTKSLPTWIAYGPAGWAMLGSLVDGAGRPIFPFLGATNALGASSLGDFDLGPLGLRQVVTPAIPDTRIFVGNSQGIEAYAYSFPVLEAPEPALLGRQIAVAEALAFYRPTTSEGPPAKGDGVCLVGP
jgi:hypothetical protein